MKPFSLATIFLTIALVACTGEDGKEGVAGPEGPKGKDAKVNVDSIANAIREEVTGTLWDSLYAEPYVDTVYQILFDNAFGTAWMDSTRQALIDSLKEADFDSLYNRLYDSVYADIYSQSVIRTLEANIWTSSQLIYGAFANQYPLMYKDFVGKDGKKYSFPLSIAVHNGCDLDNPKVPSRAKKVVLKTWIEGFTDTASVSGNVNANDNIILAPSFKFNNSALLALKAPETAQFQIRVYALENDHEILFYSTSKETQIHPMQINGGELVGVKNIELWKTVWVTPAMDSIQNILDDLKKELPDGTVKIYQKYSADETIMESSRRVAKAIFDVLHKRGIKYVQNNGAGSNGQKINYPIEVLRSRDGLCIETTVLFASILEALGMRALIVEIPGHAFVGWYVEKNSDIADFLETTMLGDKNATFAAALISATQLYEDEVDAGNFENGKSVIIDVKAAREYGIMPNDIP